MLLVNIESFVRIKQVWGRRQAWEKDISYIIESRSFRVYGSVSWVRAIVSQYHIIPER